KGACHAAPAIRAEACASCARNRMISSLLCCIVPQQPLARFHMWISAPACRKSRSVPAIINSISSGCAAAARATSFLLSSIKVLTRKTLFTLHSRHAPVGFFAVSHFLTPFPILHFKNPSFNFFMSGQGHVVLHIYWPKIYP